jgi:peroxiredoxin Q/BCP
MAKKARRKPAGTAPATAKPKAKTTRTAKPSASTRRSAPVLPKASAAGTATGAKPSTAMTTTAKPSSPKAKRPAARASAAAGGWLEVGKPAPDFTLPTHDGSTLSLKSLRGKPVVIYFYPKDDTPGCTVEACGFRDALPRLDRHRAVILGISPDGPASHARFRTKHKLSFTLLADEEHAVADRFGAWREKSLYGRTYMGIARSTFIIDASGRVAAVFTTVKPAGHADEVLAVLAKLT